MSDTKLIQAILDKVKIIDGKIEKGFRELKEEIFNNRGRIDKFGLELAELSDDSLTIEEFDDLEKRVKRVEKQVASN